MSPIKRGFTLLEIIITLMIIGIALTMVSNLGQGFSDRVRFANAKEEVLQAIHNAIQDAATSNAINVGTGQKKYETMSIVLLSGSMLQTTFASGELSAPEVRQTRLAASRVATTGFMLTLKPYAVGCQVSGGNYTVSLATKPSLQACYTTDPLTCKVRELPCN